MFSSIGSKTALFATRSLLVLNLKSSTHSVFWSFWHRILRYPGRDNAGNWADLVIQSPMPRWLWISSVMTRLCRLGTAQIVTPRLKFPYADSYHLWFVVMLRLHVPRQQQQLGLMLESRSAIIGIYIVLLFCSYVSRKGKVRWRKTL